MGGSLSASQKESSTSGSLQPPVEQLKKAKEGEEKETDIAETGIKEEEEEEENKTEEEIEREFEENTEEGGLGRLGVSCTWQFSFAKGLDPKDPLSHPSYFTSTLKLGKDFRFELNNVNSGNAFDNRDLFSGTWEERREGERLSLFLHISHHQNTVIRHSKVPLIETRPGNQIGDTASISLSSDSQLVLDFNQVKRLFQPI